MTTTETAAERRDRENRERQEKRAASLALLPPLKQPPERWWVGHNEEWFDTHEDTREAAIRVGRSDYEGGFNITCARQGPVDLAAHFDLDRMMEDIDEGGDYLSGDGPSSVFEGVPQDALDDLDQRIRLTIRQWQIEMQSAGHEVAGDLFSSSHSGEYFPGETA